MHSSAIMQFKTLQEKLNRLCSQHDELMSLLDIVDYLANLKGMAQANRSTLAKITALEQAIEEIREAQGTQRVHQQELGSFKLQRFKKSIGQIEQKLQDYNNLLLAFDGNLKKLEKESSHFSHTRDVSQVNSTLQGMMEGEEKYNQAAIAAYRNDLSKKVIETERMVQTLTSNQQSQSNSSINIQELISKVLSNELQQYDKLAHELSLYRLQFPIPQILPFVTHNYDQIKREINSIASTLNLNNPILTPSELSIIKQQFHTIYFRVRALKNHVLCQLLQLYQQQSKKLQVNRIEKQVGSMIKQLQNRLQLIHDFLSKADPILPSPPSSLP